MSDGGCKDSDSDSVTRIVTAGMEEYGQMTWGGLSMERDLYVWVPSGVKDHGIFKELKDI